MMMACSVYILHQKETTYFKVGVANDVEQRLTQINCVGTEIILIREYVMFNRDDALKLEQSMMFFLKPFHVKGEWFNLNRFILGELDDFILRFIDFRSAHYWFHPHHVYFASITEYQSYVKFLYEIANKHPEFIKKELEHSLVTPEIDENRHDSITISKMKRNETFLS